MITAAVALVLETAREYLVDHPDLAKRLITGAIDTVKQLGEHGEKEMSVEQRTAISAGLAAYRSNIIQEFVRRKGAKA